jgi:hypothetical protein
VYPMPLQPAGHVTTAGLCSRILCNRKLRSKQHVTSVMFIHPSVLVCFVGIHERAPNTCCSCDQLQDNQLTASSFARLFWGTKGHKIKISVLTLKYSR